MHLVIKSERLISEVQKDFSQAYPFLKIEFFRNGNTHRKHYPVDRMIAPGVAIKDASYRNSNEGELEINNTMTVSELETALIERFGLSAQLFRKSGNLWLETTITDNWTLGQQNEHAREISSIYRTPRNTEENDYDLNR